MGVRVREHNGVFFLEHAKTPVDAKGTFTHEGKHYVLTGPLAVVEMRNSWKFPDELHITLHTQPMFVVEKLANPTKWSRIELALPFNLGLQLLANALDSLSESSDRYVTQRDNLATILLGGP